MTRADKYLAVAIVLLAVLAAAASWQRLFAPLRQPSAALAVIRAPGGGMRRIDLGQHATFAVPGRLGPSTVEVEGGKVRMREAPCPNQICVGQGWIEHPGEAIVCVPGEVVIRIEGAAPLDAVTR